MNRLMSDDALQLVSYLFYALFFILAIFLVGPGARDYALAVSTVAALCLAVFGLFAPLRKNKAVSLVPEVLVLIGVFLYLIFFGAMNLLILSFLLVLVATEAYMRSRATYAVMVSAILFLITAFGLFRIEPFTTAAFLNDLVIPIVVILIAALVFRIFSTEARTLRQKNKQISKELGSLTAQTEELNELVNGLSEGLISAGINNKITFLNRAAEKILTAESAELIGKNIDDFFLTATENGKFSVAGEVLKSQKSTKYPNILLFTKGQTFKVSVSAEPVFDKAGEMVGLVILFRDITQERLLDEQKAEFNAVASHELRTPLAVIDGYAFDLLNDKTLKYDAKTKENIMAISEATESLIQLTNDILTITKVENNQLKINLEKTDLKKLITEVSLVYKAPA